ncbi:MAG TPA: DUF4349 domain-containing protein [Planctomycetota bacterium]|nr:DUF4349 domain-containing protein [Planctomycetota bacterium]
MRSLLLALLLLPLACVSVRAAPAEKQEADRGLASGDFSGEMINLVPSAYKLKGEEDQLAAQDRLLIRTGELTVRSGNPEEVGARAERLVGASGGYVITRENNTYVFRVPAEKFDEVFAQLAALGAVAHRRMDASDVTEEVQDLELRLRNARALRDRYEELLKRAEKVEDVLAIQKELAAVTETIERLEGQLKARMTDVKMSRITLRLEPAAAGPVTALRSPFPWVRALGIENLPQYRSDRARSTRLDWSLPAGFADMGRPRDSDIVGWAYSPDGVRVVVRRFEHEPEADRAFWDAELERDFVKARGYEPWAAPPDSKLIVFRTIADGTPTTYALRLSIGSRYILATEVIGPADVVEAKWPVLLPLLDQVEKESR